MKLRTQIHLEHRQDIEKTDIISLLTPSSKFANNRQFVLSLMSNIVENQEHEIQKIIQEFQQKAANYYSDKLNYYQTTTQQLLSYEGDINPLPPWYDENGKVNNYYLENVLDENLKRDLSLLSENKSFKGNYKFEFLDFDMISKSLSETINEQNDEQKSKKILCIKIIFFILVVVGIILMILFFIV